MWIRGLFGLALAGLLLAPGLSKADSERSYPTRAAAQLTRGIMNVAAAPWEVPVNMYKEQQRADDAGANYGGQGAAILTGTLTGAGFSVLRVLVAASEIVTFAIPNGPWMKPANPNLLLETFGPPSPHSFFRLARRPADMPRQQRRFWASTGGDDNDFYHDRFDCAAQTLRNGLFNACMERRGWLRTTADH